MRAIFLFIIICFTALAGKTQYSISGTVSGLNYSQGGAAKIHDEVPYILGNKTFFLIRIDDTGKQQETFQLKSNPDGTFKAKLPKGTYIISESEKYEAKNEIEPIEMSLGYHHSVTWYNSTHKQIVVSGDNQTFNIIRKESHICYMCP